MIIMKKNTQVSVFPTTWTFQHKTVVEKKTPGTKETRSLAAGRRVNRELNLQCPSRAVAPPASPSLRQLLSHVLAHTWSSHIGILGLVLKETLLWASALYLCQTSFLCQLLNLLADFSRIWWSGVNPNDNQKSCAKLVARRHSSRAIFFH